VGYDGRPLCREVPRLQSDLQPNSDNPHRRPQRSFFRLWVSLALVGTLSTVLWVSAVPFPDFQRHVFSLPVLSAMALCVVMTSTNLVLRWLRWHFLIRRFTLQLATRDSLTVYFATLPAIVTPFLAGELVRVLILKKRFRQPAMYLARIWLTERILDVAVLLSALLCSMGDRWGLLLPFAVVVATPLWFRGLMRTASRSAVVGVSAVSLFTTVVAWAFPVLALSSTLWILASPCDAATTVRAFSAGTLFGGVTGLPLGVFVTGSTMISELVRGGVSTWASVLGVIVYRAGTAWFAVLLGLGTIVLFRQRLARLVRGESGSHFDEIAEEYQDEIPAHVRERLLEKKVGFIDRLLRGRGLGNGAHGLDLGCGQGWYLAALTRLGYRVDGADAAEAQVQRAALFLRENGIQHASLMCANAEALPFGDNTFDFVYSINAIHHILSPGSQLRAFQEIVRVLRPGGVFVLHEINTNNPIFRLYMGYLFPLIKKIDEGNEAFILPAELPPIKGASWSSEVEHFTFLPDFVPSRIQRLFAGFERRLEQSRLRHFSAHYQACLVKNDGRESSLRPLP